MPPRRFMPRQGLSAAFPFLKKTLNIFIENTVGYIVKSQCLVTDLLIESGDCERE
jgi:hypothetical protein